MAAVFATAVEVGRYVPDWLLRNTRKTECGASHVPGLLLGARRTLCAFEEPLRTPLIVKGLAHSRWELTDSQGDVPDW
jgi:hypothetical protein